MIKCLIFMLKKKKTATEVARAPQNEINKKMEEIMRRGFENLQKDIVKIIGEALSPIQQELKVHREDFEEEDNQKESKEDEEEVVRRK